MERHHHLAKNHQHWRTPSATITKKSSAFGKNHQQLGKIISNWDELRYNHQRLGENNHQLG